MDIIKINRVFLALSLYGRFYFCTNVYDYIFEINNNYKKKISYSQSLECRQGHKLLHRTKRYENKYTCIHFAWDKLLVEQ